ncbi:hypothetical protein M409DRAFT_68459 [Zasmidium cellare ATCC 36951]|uniref:FAD dependent oxidoreductase domain-containing protein n=1 Tax=Zasmidium cellare ATCC 36951 TaxID=1080233 RepID=A0A6A6CBG0_ZASCE|nr:uncharacterized protein M409DRAFT_68459 [Zasmidium cellare ATCC 36951]KAF2163550.1 hypothetical protein M409DRAFT_68459 [Zasmidium cellare ATCC 36951]
MRLEGTHDVVVLGAGVTGLQTAVTLLEEGYRVTVIADQLPGDISPCYASPWAGAQWRSHSSPDDGEQQSWDRKSYLHWKQICFDEHARNVAFEERSGLTTSDGFWFREFVDGFDSAVSAGEAGKPYATVRYRSVFVDVPIYLRHLLGRVRQLGGQVIRSKVPDDNGIAGAVKAASDLVKQYIGPCRARKCVFINATGLRARQLCGDKAVHPVRGQVLVVKGVPKEAATRLSRDEETGESTLSYVIPRPLSGVTIIGGCNQKDNWNTDEDVEITGQIKERCAALAPELLTGPGKTFEVIGCQIGLRPARTGGARVESEAIGDRSGGVRWVIHAYGHGGGGFQNSIGVAEEVSRLVAELPEKSRARL